MKIKKAISLLMTLVMMIAALSLPATATVSTTTYSQHYLMLDYDSDQGSITLDPVGKASGSTKDKYYYYGEPKVNITVTPEEGYRIKSITSIKYMPQPPGRIAEEMFIPDPADSVEFDKRMYCDRKIRVVFEKAYTATAHAFPPNGGTATVNGETSITTAAGAEIKFRAEPNEDEGYAFDGWYGCDIPVAYSTLGSPQDTGPDGIDNGGENGSSLVTRENPYQLELEEDISLTALFKLKEYDLTLEVIGKGEAEGGGIYSHGEAVEVIATPGEGYTFVGWFEGQPIQLMALSEDSDEEEDLCLVSEDNPYSFELLEDTSLIAKFVELTHQVTLDRIGDGTVTGAGTYTHGANLDVSATPDSGWHFDNWYYGGETLNPVEYPVTTDMAITAKFLKDQKPDPRPSSGSSSRSETKYTLNVSVEGDGSVLPEGTRTYSKGTTVVLVPTPNEGSVLMGWFGEDGGEVVDNTLLMNGDKSIIVRFSSEEEAVPETEEPVLEPEPEEEIVVILDNEIPISSPDLPQTGGIPLELLLASGTLMITGGIAVRRKRRKN